jgi:Flp pilus assembly protein TadG
MSHPMKRYGWNEGAVAHEAAITFSLLIVLAYGVIQLGIAFWQLNTTELAVLQAGRWAMVHNSDKTLVPDVETQLQAALPGATASCPLPSSPSAGNWYVCATETAATAGNPAVLNLSALYAFNLLVPAKLVLGVSGPYTVISQATIPVD